IVSYDIPGFFFFSSSRRHTRSKRDWSSDVCSSDLEDLTEYRRLGQLHIVINPAFFTSVDGFLEHISETMLDLNAVTPASGFDEVLYPGQPNERIQELYEKEGIEIVDDIYEYLISEDIHYNQYDHKDPFAEYRF